MANKLNELQRIDLEILKSIISICEKHDFSYYALGGTLLGAVRHQGFIPWDDDIDIALPRPDYEKLLSACETELSKDFIIQNYKTMPDDPAPTYLTRVGRVGTLVSYGVANEAKLMPIWIDVFPLDSMPTNSVSRTWQKYRLLYQRLKFQFSTYDANAHQHRPNRPLHEKVLMKFREVTKVGQSWDPIKILAETEQIAGRFDYDQEDYLVNLFGAYKFREMFPKSWFGGGIVLPFEDQKIRCPVEYDKVLSQMYGNYMIPAKTKERDQHHMLTVIRLSDEAASERQHSDGVADGASAAGADNV